MTSPLFADGWFKSSSSNPSQSCVEVLFDEPSVHVRDSKYRRDPRNVPAEEPIITVTIEQWSTFLGELAGQAPTGANGALEVDAAPDGSVVLRRSDHDVRLSYTQFEWKMFLVGVQRAEFCPPAANGIAS